MIILDHSYISIYTPKAKGPKAIEKEVQKYASLWEDQVKNGEVFDGEKMKLYEVVDLWRENWADRNLTLAVREDYERILAKRFLDKLGYMPVSKIQAIQIDKIMSECLESGLSPKSVRYYFTVINSVMTYAYKKSLIKENPCSRCDLPKIKRDTSLHYFTLEQSKTFLKALEREYISVHRGHERKLSKTGFSYEVGDYEEHHKIPTQYVSFFKLAIYGGFRRGELLGLTWEDIDFDRQTVSINKALTSTQSKGQILKCPKTVASERTIRLPKTCFDSLRAWKREEVSLCMKLQSEGKWSGSIGEDFNKNFVFIQLSSGKAMGIDTPYQVFTKVIDLYNSTCEREEDKLPKIRLHDLRHTSATLLLAENTDIETVSHRLGHSRASITLDVYGHALETTDNKASDTLDRLFG